MISFVYALLCILLGNAIMLAVVTLSVIVDERRIKEIAAEVCTAKEKVLCYNATIIANDAGTKLVWFDNDKIKVAKYGREI